MSKLFIISAVGGSAPTYQLTIDSSTGISINDHVSDSLGQIYRVSAINDSTKITVVDDVAPDAPEGTPTAGAAAVWTPTARLQLSQSPRETVFWDEILRRDLRKLDVGGMTTAAVNLWVATNGLDTNPGTQAEPFLTIQAAVDSLPKLLRHSVSIKIAAGTYSGFTVRGFQIVYASANAGAGLIIDGTMANAALTTGAATGTVTSFVQGTVGTNTYAVVNDTAQSWTINDLVGRFLVATGGTASGLIFPIVSNTATQVTLAGTFVTVLDGTTTYAIQEPGTIINTTVATAGSAPTYTVANSRCVFVSNVDNPGDVDTLLFRFLKVVPPANSSGVVFGTVKQVTIQNCLFSGASITNGFAGISRSGNGTVDRLQCIQSSFISPTPKTGMIGLSLGVTTSGAQSWAGRMANNVFINGLIAMTLAGTWGVTNNYCSGQSTALQTGGAPLYLYQSGSGIQITGCNTGISGLGVGAGVSQLYMQLNGPISINNAATVAITLNGPSTIVDNGSTGFIGSGNAIGIKLAVGARLQFPAAATLTGTTEIQIDGVNQTFAAMRAASPKLLTNTYGTIIYE